MKYINQLMYVYIFFSQSGACQCQAQGQVGMSCRLGGGHCGHGQHCQPEAREPATSEVLGQGASSELLAPHPKSVRAWWELWGM